MTRSPARPAGVDMPAVSICLPIWNDARHVEIAVRSAMAQTMPDWELIVGDNVSDDDLAAVLARYSDPRIVHHRFTDHVDVYTNLNRTMALARAEWVVPLGADDSLRITALADVLAEARRAQGTDAGAPATGSM